MLVLLCLLSLQTWGQTRRALIIGIGNYPEDSGWITIHGNNDVAIIKNALIRQGFTDDNIIQLKDSQATKAGILNGFELLESGCTEGDIVYVHFSGHGQQITDLNGDEDDGFDESWVPYDAKIKYEAGVYEGENHLVDDELNSLIRRIRTRVGKKGKIVVVADACHSGSGSRGPQLGEEYIFRGSSKRFILPADSGLDQFSPKEIDWLFVAACKPYQTNFEYRTSKGMYFGLLSFIIASDGRDFGSTDYLELVEDWSRRLCTLSAYPQDLDVEGRPSRFGSSLF